MSEGGEKKLGLREDWAAAAYLLIACAGFVVSAYDFWKFQNLSFRLSLSVVIGVALLVIGGILRLTSRRALMRAGFGLLNSSRLQIVEGQRLITDGVYGLIRHPLYLGEMTRNLGIAMTLSSLYGAVVILVGNAFLLLRIENEERMLIEEFGQEYKDYKKRTKKLIPYLY